MLMRGAAPADWPAIWAFVHRIAATARRSPGTATSRRRTPAGTGCAGGRRAGDDRTWTVMADPEGNEFCAFTE
jgi:Glyoxalase-like domain